VLTSGSGEGIGLRGADVVTVQQTNEMITQRTHRLQIYIQKITQKNAKSKWN